MRARETRRIKAMAGALLIASLATAASAGPLDGSLPIIQRSKYDPQTEFQAGMAALSDQKFAEAKSDFEHVLSVAPDHPAALYEVGVAEAALGDLKGAARDYASALKSNPNLIEALRQLALTNVRLGREDQARQQLARLKHFAVTCASACLQAKEISDGIAEVEAGLSAPAAPAKPPAG